MIPIVSIFLGVSMIMFIAELYVKFDHIDKITPNRKAVVSKKK